MMSFQTKAEMKKARDSLEETWTNEADESARAALEEPDADPILHFDAFYEAIAEVSFS